MEAGLPHSQGSLVKSTAERLKRQVRGVDTDLHAVMVLLLLREDADGLLQAGMRDVISATSQPRTR